MHPAAEEYSKVVMTILTHLMIHKLNSNTTPAQKIAQLCSMVVRETESHPQLLTLDTKVAILYNCLKTLLGMKTVSKSTEESLFRLY